MWNKVLVTGKYRKTFRSHVTNIHLNDAIFKLFRHPPYLPNLAPSDYWLFDRNISSLDNHSDMAKLPRECKAY